MAAFHSMINRLLSLPLSNEDYYAERNTIKHIAITNGYKETIINSILKKHKKRKNTDIHRAPVDNTYIYISIPYTAFMPRILTSILNKTNNIIFNF